MNINQFIASECILAHIDIVFANRNSDPVFFCNGLSESDLASANYSISDPELVKYRSVDPLSMKDAVRLAKNNNIMGLICSARLLVCFLPTIHPN